MAAQEQPGDLDSDLLMKGGITSGVVYAAAIADVGETYRVALLGGISGKCNRLGRHGDVPDLLVGSGRRLSPRLGRSSMLLGHSLHGRPIRMATAYVAARAKFASSA